MKSRLYFKIYLSINKKQYDNLFDVQINKISVL